MRLQSTADSIVMQATRLPRKLTMWSCHLLLAAYCTLLTAGSCIAQSPAIHLSLDLYYRTPDDPESGGSWELIATSSHRGIAALAVALVEIESVQLRAPSGRTSDQSYFGFRPWFAAEDDSFAQQRGEVTELLLAQIPQATLLAQGLLYDVGAPLGASRPGEQGTPLIDNIISSRSIPWPMQDELGWFVDAYQSPERFRSVAGGVVLASGLFSAGRAPAFAGDSVSRGNVFTQLGEPFLPPPVGSIQAAFVTTQVRSNQGALPGDANLDGLVDVRDFNIWHAHRLGEYSGWRYGDFDASGGVDAVDLAVWKDQRFEGLDFPVAVPVPEPYRSVRLVAFCWLALRFATSRASRKKKAHGWQSVPTDGVGLVPHSHSPRPFLSPLASSPSWKPST